MLRAPVRPRPQEPPPDRLHHHTSPMTAAFAHRPAQTSRALHLAVREHDNPIHTEPMVPGPRILPCKVACCFTAEIGAVPSIATLSFVCHRIRSKNMFDLAFWCAFWPCIVIIAAAPPLRIEYAFSPGTPARERARARNAYKDIPDKQQGAAENTQTTSARSGRCPSPVPSASYSRRRSA